MVEKLIEYLRKLENGEIEFESSIGEEEDDLSSGNTDTHYNIKFTGKTFINEDSLPKEMVSLIYECLMTTGGGVNEQSRKELRDVGFKTYPLESDSFGWLIGGIETKKGIISFG